MDFFERQREAKKKTSWLVFLFSLAVLFVFLLNHLIVAFALATVRGPKGKPDFSTLTDIGLALWVFLGTIVLVGLASLCRGIQLREGGSAIATMLGGRLVNMSTTHPDERKLINVVEEMAIASSVPMPEVYVMDGEDAINAFAAGFSLDDAVIGVTAGCINQLSRDELQGVIAHEFSHILNHDMRLNLRLVAVVFGLIVLMVIGRIIIRVGFHSTRRRGNKKGGAMVAIGLVGVGLWVAGRLGVFMGSLIKSAVSRQREFFADSAAVQFTRNPEGLAGALKKIGAMGPGGVIRSPSAEQASHMFFSRALRKSWFGLTATHPPLVERIRLLDQSFDGDFSQMGIEDREVVTVPPGLDTPPVQSSAGVPLPGIGDSLGEAGLPVAMGLAPMGQATVRVGSTENLVESIGNPTAEHVEFSAALLSGLPDSVKQAAHDTHDASALVFALFLDKKNGDVRQKQLAQVQNIFGPHMAKVTAALYGEVLQLDRRALLPVADLAVGSLKQLSPDQFDGFRRVINELIQADQAIDLFEYSLAKLVLRHLIPHFSKHARQVTKLYSLKRLGVECSVLISALAYLAGDKEEAIQSAFKAGQTRLASATTINRVAVAQCGLREVDMALTQLNGVSPNLKRLLILSAVDAVSADGFLRIEEAELIRAISSSLDCPMPPVGHLNQASL